MLALIIFLCTSIPQQLFSVGYIVSLLEASEATARTGNLVHVPSRGNNHRCLRLPGPRAVTRQMQQRARCHPFSGPTVPPPAAISGHHPFFPSIIPPVGRAARPPCQPARATRAPFLRLPKLMPPGCHFPSLPGAEGARPHPRV